MNKRGQADAISNLAKTILGVMIFLILVSGTVGIYNAFFAERISAAEKDRDTAILKLGSMIPGRTEESLTSCQEDICKGYDIMLLHTGNLEQRCNGVACVCVDAPDIGMKCKRLENIAADCKSDKVCVKQTSATHIDPSKNDDVGKPVLVCRKGENSNELFIGDKC